MPKNIIRLTSYEKRNIPIRSKLITLFYYKETTVKLGEIYSLPTILKYGQRKLGGTEIQPVLSFKKMSLVKCIEVENNISYENIPRNIFKYTLQHIKDVPSIKRNILNRYLKSRPYLTKEEILKNGVAYTTLEII